MKPIVQILGSAAIAGGVLRIADSFVTGLFSLGTLTLLYLETDVFLLLGIAGVYLARRTTIGITGTIGTAIFVFGILLVRLSAFSVLGANGYQIGAIIALFGLAILSVETLQRRNEAYLSAALWILSMALGIAIAVGILPASMTIPAGVTFGAGFVAAGAETLAS
jgi:hypothetical protein